MRSDFTRKYFAVCTILLLPGLVASSCPTAAQTPVTNYALGTVTDLRSIDLSSYPNIVVAGYYSANDNGGGQFTLGASCAFTTTGSASAGSTTVTVGSTAGIAPNMAVNSFGSTAIPAGDTVASVGAGATTLTAPTAAIFSGTLVLGGNGGSVIIDGKNSTTPNCFYRVNSTWSPTEFGAHMNCCGSGTLDDWPSLQAWLNANQPHMGVPGISAISAPLVCAQSYSSFSGPPRSGTNETGQELPLFQIQAAATLSVPFTGPAMLQMNAGGCAIHEVGLIAPFGSPFDIVDSNAEAVLIDGAYLSGGVNDFNCTTSYEDVQIFDSFLVEPSVTAIEGAGCANLRIERNVISDLNGTGYGIHYSGSEATIANNTIEQSGNAGVFLDSARQVRVIGNYLDNNGKTTLGAGGLEISGSNYVTATGNIFHRSGLYTEGSGSNSSHVFFTGLNDSITFNGNTYFTDNSNDSTIVRPDYVFDADPATVLTNGSFQDRPGPANAGVCTPTAVTVLGSACPPYVAKSYGTGLRLVYVSGHQITIQPGQASDSTNSATMTLVNACPIDATATNGLGALDTGSLQASTTYYFFIVSGPGGTNPNCIMSKSLTPSFAGTGGGYIGSISQPPASTYNGSKVVFNVGGPATGTNDNTYPSPLAGMAVGQPIKDTSSHNSIPTSPVTTIASLRSVYDNTTGTIESAGGSGVIDSVPSIALIDGRGAPSPGNVVPGMSITAPGRYLAMNAYIQSVDSGCTPAPHCLVVSPNNLATSPSGTSFTVGGQFSITLSQAATATTGGASTATRSQLSTPAELIRLVGAVFTNSNISSPAIVSFLQDNDTFYLTTPAVDIDTGNSGGNACNNGTIGNADIDCPLSVPTGIKVQAFGRLTGGNGQVIVSSLDANPRTPGPFPGPPGYSSEKTAPNSAYPFLLYTDTNGQIRIHASASGTSVYEDTDGWVYFRFQ